LCPRNTQEYGDSYRKRTTCSSPAAAFWRFRAALAARGPGKAPVKMSSGRTPR
jgi:hypothetical protein